MINNGANVIMEINGTKIFSTTSATSESPTYFEIDPSNYGGSAPSTPIDIYWLRTITYVSSMPTYTIGNITSSQNPTDVGNSVTFTASPSGGTGSYTYQWYLLSL